MACHQVGSINIKPGRWWCSFSWAKIPTTASPRHTRNITSLSLIFFLSLIYMYIYSDQGIVVLTCVHKVSPRRKWMETTTLKSLGFALGMRLGLWLAQLSLIVVLIGSILIRHTIYLLKIPNLHASIRACNCLSQNYLSPSSYPQFFLILIVCLFYSN